MPAATKERSGHDRSTVSEIFSVQHNCSSARNKSTDSTASPQTPLPRQVSCMRAVLGIEPRTSRTLSENHTTRPNSRCSAPDVNTKALSEVVIQATHRHIQQRWQTGAWRAVRTRADVAPTHGGKLASCIKPTLKNPLFAGPSFLQWQMHGNGIAVRSADAAPCGVRTRDRWLIRPAL